MRVTSLNQLGAALRLPPSSLSAFRQLSLDDVAKLNVMIDEAHASYRLETEDAVRELLPFLRPAVVMRALGSRRNKR